MSDGKKDVLEFPLEELEVPAAIKLMMQAAYKTGYLGEVAMTHDERILQLSEKLEARVEDAIDAAKAVREEPVSEDAPNEVAIVETDIFLMNDDLTINYKGILFHRTCNQPVVPETEGTFPTYCIKVANHQHPEHEDIEGNRR